KLLPELLVFRSTKSRRTFYAQTEREGFHTASVDSGPSLSCGNRQQWVESGRPTVLRSWMPNSASESLNGTIWRRVDCGLRLQSGLAGDLRAGAREPAYRSRSPCADYRAYLEDGGGRPGLQTHH